MQKDVREQERIRLDSGRVKDAKYSPELDCGGRGPQDGSWEALKTGPGSPQDGSWETSKDGSWETSKDGS